MASPDGLELLLRRTRRANQKTINVNANGTMTYANQGGTQGTNAFGMTVSYAL